MIGCCRNHKVRQWMCMSDLLINQMIHDTKMKHDLIHVGECSNKECQYLHIDPESKIKDCPWYDRGFCKHGMSLHISITVMQFTGKRLKRLKRDERMIFPIISIPRQKDGNRQ